MKKVTVVAIALAISLLSFGQEREYQTIVDFNDVRISGLGGPFMQFTAVDGEFAHMLGGGGAILVGNFWLGGYGLGLTNRIYVDHLRDDIYSSGDRLNVSHGGFWVGYSLFGEAPIHVAISSLFGWGQISVSRDEYYDNRYIQDGIFMIAPTLEVELNLTQFFRISAGASYNIYTFVDSNTLPGYTSSDFSAPGGFLAFKFGWF